jgi:subtilisin family serine protease
MSSVAADNLFRRNADVVSYTRDGIATIVQASPTRGRPQNPGGGNGGQVKQVIPWGVARVGGAGNGTGKRVWVLDTGVDLDHPDLNVAETDNISFLTKGKDHASPDDFNGHGTHVAGTIAALNNDKDVIGVAAGATVASVRVLDKRGSGSWSGVIAGIDYVAANGNSGDVANMSLGGPKNTAVNDAVEAAAEKGIIFSLAAGNESTNAETRSPASANHANIYTVSAINDSDKFASFSNYGSPVDYAAPGVSVKSLAIGGGISTKSGTSMAAPHVAGILLLGSISPGGPATGDPDDPDDQIATH